MYTEPVKVRRSKALSGLSGNKAEAAVVSEVSRLPEVTRDSTKRFNLKKYLSPAFYTTVLCILLFRE